MTSCDEKNSIVSSAVEKREQKIIADLIRCNIIKRVKHPYTGFSVYVRSDEDILTDEVEEFAHERLKKILPEFVIGRA